MISRNNWSKFVLNHKSRNIFQTPEIYDVYKYTTNYEPIFLAHNKGNEIAGILLAVIQKEYNGILGALTSRAIVWGGPLVKDNDAIRLDEILKKYDAEIKNKAIYSQFRNLWKWSDEEKKVFLSNGYIYEDHLDIINKIENEKSIWANFKSSARNKIRKSINNNLIFREIKSKEEINEIYSILKSVYNRAKLPLAEKNLFESAYKILNDKNLIKFFVACKDDRIVGCRIVFTYKKIIYDWYAGAKSEFYKFNPNDFLPWKIMEWGSKNGYEKFDFGGAGKPNEPYGVRDFKLKFGGELVNFGRFQKIHKPLLMKVGKVGLEIFSFLRKFGLK
jgi:lipid II:glycine glycyltransferase (peptidoglycan interpeptide bridge formation enzyme)